MHIFKLNILGGEYIVKLYSVINIDIIGSRKIKNREEVQARIIENIKLINNKFKSILCCPINITLGDEWQVVLDDISKSYEIINMFQQILRKEKIQLYAGIGIGTISTKLYEDTRLMDGEAFIFARQALNIIKQKNRFYNKFLNSKKNNVYFNGVLLFDRKSRVTLNSMINVTIENNEVLKSQITEKQYMMIELYDRAGSYNNVIYKRRDISKSNISKKLNDSNYFVIKNNNKLLEAFIKTYCSILGDNRYDE